jgi:hypothetical protein
MATEARVRELLIGIAAEIDAASATAIPSECAATANDYKAAANLIRVFCALMATKPESYRMTDGKQFSRVNLFQIRSLADDYDKMAVQGGAFATVDGKFAVDVAGRDVTEYEEDA